MSDDIHDVNHLRCEGKVKAPWLTDEQREKGWDRCYRKTRDESGFCYQHRDAKGITSQRLRDRQMPA